MIPRFSQNLSNVYQEIQTFQYTSNVFFLFDKHLLNIEVTCTRLRRAALLAHGWSRAVPWRLAPLPCRPVSPRPCRCPYPCSRSAASPWTAGTPSATLWCSRAQPGGPGTASSSSGWSPESSWSLRPSSWSAAPCCPAWPTKPRSSRCATSAGQVGAAGGSVTSPCLPNPWPAPAVGKLPSCVDCIALYSWQKREIPDDTPKSHRVTPTIWDLWKCHRRYNFHLLFFRKKKCKKEQVYDSD